jgi:flagellar biosynthesis/type III secretory pathway chaperone
MGDIDKILNPMIEQYQTHGKLINDTTEQKRLDKIAELKEQQKGIEAVVITFNPSEEDKQKLREEWKRLYNEIKKLQQGRLF